MITLMFHLEPVGDDGVVWWIDCPEVPGFYATADQIGECRVRALDALAEEGYDTSNVVEQLVVDALPIDIDSGQRPSVEVDGSSADRTNGDQVIVLRSEPALV